MAEVTSGKAELERLLARPEIRVADLLALLAPNEPVDGEASGADFDGDLERSRRHASRFVLGSSYGTRTSTVVLLDGNCGGVFVERSFDAHGRSAGDVAFEFGGPGISRRAVRGSRLDRVPGRPAATGTEREEARDGP